MNRKVKSFLIACTILGMGVLNAQEYKLVWQDNFDGSTIDSSLWNIEQTIGIWNTGANREQQHYKKENVSVGDDGSGNNCLILTAKKEDYNGYAFTSGKVTTKGKFAFRKGKLEALIRVPNLENGLWPAFWTLGYTEKGWPDCGEIDILEMGHTHAIEQNIVNNFIGAHLFWGPYDGGFPNYGTEYTTEENLSEGYFKHTVIWDDNKISVYFNDATEPYFAMGISGDQFNEFHDFQHYILFNLAVGGAFTGIYDAAGITAPLPANMYVDWVKLYQEDESNDFESNLPLHGEFGVYEDKSTADMRMDLGYDLFENINGLTARAGETPYEGDNVLSYSTTSGQDFEAKYTAGLSRNFEKYVTGSVQFQIKTDLTGDIQIGITDNNGSEKFVTFNSDNENDFSRDGTWQLAYLTLADFEGDIDLSSLKDLLIVKGTAGADGYISIDKIMYNQSTPAKGYYFVYSDNTNMSDGFVPDGVDYNVYVWDGTVGFNEYYGAYEGENVYSFKSQGGAGWFGFGFHSGVALNFDAYANGYLNISIRTESTDAFYIGMDDKTDGTAQVDFNGSNDPYGLERDGEWHHLNIPIADLTSQGLNLSEINHVFKSGGVSIGNIAYDDIYLSETLPTIENPSICVTGSIEVKPNGKTVEVGEEQTFVADVFNQYGNKFDSYVTWSADGGIIDSEGVFSSDATGEFYITASQDGITGTASIVVEEATDIQGKDDNEINIYYANNKVMLKGVKGESTVSIYNAAGAQVKKQVLNGEMSIDLSNQAAGVYIVSVNSNSEIKTVKIVKR